MLSNELVRKSIVGSLLIDYYQLPVFPSFLMFPRIQEATEYDYSQESAFGGISVYQ